MRIYEKIVCSVVSLVHQPIVRSVAIEYWRYWSVEATDFVVVLVDLLYCVDDVLEALAYVILNRFHSRIIFWVIISFWRCKDTATMNPEQEKYVLSSSFVATVTSKCDKSREQPLNLSHYPYFYLLISLQVPRKHSSVVSGRHTYSILYSSLESAHIGEAGILGNRSDAIVRVFS